MRFIMGWIGAREGARRGLGKRAFGMNGPTCDLSVVARAIESE